MIQNVQPRKLHKNEDFKVKDEMCVLVSTVLFVVSADYFPSLILRQIQGV